MNRSAVPQSMPSLGVASLAFYVLMGVTQTASAQYPAQGDSSAVNRVGWTEGFRAIERDSTISESALTPAAVSLGSSSVGDVVELKVTGNRSGTVWGSIVYTSDSNLAAAAVHAGVLKDGETGWIKVTVLPGRDNYEGSARHGVSSHDYPFWDKSYWIERSSKAPVVNDVDRVGAQTVISMTGRTDGTIWGDGIYTDDSDMATAAVHSGILKPGEIGWVRVTRLPGQQSYEACDRHGVSSQSWHSWSGSYRLDRAYTAADVASPPTTMTPFRGRHGHVVNLRVTGRTTGPVWGTDVYTDDSDVATAAVHAGILNEGQTGQVNITILPGRSQYRASHQNSVSSNAYGSWQGSFWIDSVTERGAPANQSPLDWSTL